MQTLSSKDLFERLDHDDAATLGVDADHLTYTPLADLDTVTVASRIRAGSGNMCGSSSGPLSGGVTWAKVA